MPFIPLFQSPKSFYRLAVASFFFLQGLVFASWASRIPDIKQALDLNEAQLGGVLFAIVNCILYMSGIVEIQFDTSAQSPWFRYTDENGRSHEVWFEDARSIQAKLALISEYGLSGAGYWNMMRPFPQNWQVLDSMYQILPN